MSSKHNILVFLVGFLPLMPHTSVYAQNETEVKLTIPKYYTVFKTNETIFIDGKPNEKAWELATWTDEFMDIQGPHMEKPRFSTRVKMLWDDTHIYFYTEMEEPHVWGDITKRDAVIFHNNDFEIFIKPNQFFSHYVEFEVNALKTLWELMLFKPYRLGGPITNHWDVNDTQIGVHVNGSLNDPGDVDKYWTVEMAIPLQAINKISRRNFVKNGTLWRINFSRVQWQHTISGNKYSRKKDSETGKLLPEDNWVWSPQGAIDMHRPEHWGYLQFSDKTPGTSAPQLNDVWSVEYQLLFHIHRQQLVYRKRNGVFITDIKELGGPSLLVGGKTYTVNMENFLNGYTLSIRNANNETLILNNDEQLSIIKH